MNPAHLGLERLAGKTSRGGFDQDFVPKEFGIGGQDFGILCGPAEEVVAHRLAADAPGEDIHHHGPVVEHPPQIGFHRGFTGHARRRHVDTLAGDPAGCIVLRENGINLLEGRPLRIGGESRTIRGTEGDFGQGEVDSRRIGFFGVRFAQPLFRERNVAKNPVTRNATRIKSIGPQFHELLDDLNPFEIWIFGRIAFADGQSHGQGGQFRIDALRGIATVSVSDQTSITSIVRHNDESRQRRVIPESSRSPRLNHLARFREGEPPGEPSHPARTEPRPPGITKGHLGTVGLGTRRLNGITGN